MAKKPGNYKARFSLCCKRLHSAHHQAPPSPMGTPTLQQPGPHTLAQVQLKCMPTPDSFMTLCKMAELKKSLNTAPPPHKGLLPLHWLILAPADVPHCSHASRKNLRVKTLTFTPGDGGGLTRGEGACLVQHHLLAQLAASTPGL